MNLSNVEDVNVNQTTLIWAFDNIRENIFMHYIDRRQFSHVPSNVFPYRHFQNNRFSRFISIDIKSPIDIKNPTSIEYYIFDI